MFIYGVNRDNPTQHLIWTPVMLTNSVDMFNYILSNIGETFYIYKKDLQNVIIKWWNFYINNVSITINDVDTSVAIENKVLTPNVTNYVYLKDNDIYINTVYSASLYPIADIVVNWSWNITSITRHKFKELYDLNWYVKSPISIVPWTWDMFWSNNLAELTNMPNARANLNVYSQIESDARYLNEASNLSDLDDIPTARTNLDVYNKLESRQVNLLFFVWDWSDWDIVISSNTTLTRDMYYNNLTVNTWFTLDTAWYCIFVKWILSTPWTWKIARNWNVWWNASWITWWIWAIILNQWSIWWEIQAWNWGWWWNGSNWYWWWNWLNSDKSFTTINWVWWWDGRSISPYIAWIWWVWWTSIQWIYYNKFYIPRYVSFPWLWLLYKWPSSSWWGWWWSVNSGIWSWGWWWGGWGNWWCIFISAYKTSWTINIESKWWNAWNWDTLNNSWWWGWWGWNWWVILFYYWIWTPTINAILTKWNWWIAWNLWTNWNDWNDWILYSILISI